MPEDGLSWAKSPDAIGLEALGRTNPLIKAPLEWSTGGSFFQHGPHGPRPLSELDPPIGRTLNNVARGLGLTERDQPVRLPLALEHAVANSPLSRFTTTARTLTDGRKGGLGKLTNTLSGMRVTDVPERVQDAAIAEAIARELFKSPIARNYSRAFVPDDLRPFASDEDLAWIDRLLEQQKILSNRRRSRE